MKIELNFTSAEIDVLSNTVCESFVAEAPERFSVISSDKSEAVPIMLSISDNHCPGTLFYFDSLLDAKIFQDFYFQKNRVEQCHILLDECIPDQWCCWTEDNFDDYESLDNVHGLDVTPEDIVNWEKSLIGGIEK